MKLYKYISSKYLKSVYENGEIYFRNLSYFKKFEKRHRNDCFEGMHRDNPDNDITIQNLTRGTKIVGNYTFINRVDSDSIFIFCLSKQINPILFERFECDICIEINDIENFTKRLNKHLVPGKTTNKNYGLLNGEVIYYKKNESIDEDINSPYRIPFLKDYSYHEQDEYRYAYGIGSNCLKIVKQLVSKEYKYEEESKNVFEKSMRVTIGNISDIAKVLYKKT